MTLRQVRGILEQALETGTVKWIYFEGGEPFLYYPILIKGVQLASEMGFHVGIVSNGYWATSLEDAIEWLSPLTGLIEDLSVSSDLYHGNENIRGQAEIVGQAAETLGLPLGVISIAQPRQADIEATVGQLPLGESGVMYRGRASEKLIEGVPLRSWKEFNECPHEDLKEPGRVHVDPLGHLHICQGISIGNIFQNSLTEICEQYDVTIHPITGPIYRGGPAELVEQFDIAHEQAYTDACHLCYVSRRDLRKSRPEHLLPEQMYGEIS
jgi:MoaA/NifB/PqqE/SkfB family radical SAM enzyme